MSDRWTWDSSTNPDVFSAFTDSDWPERLEAAPSDPIVGKALCVCAALAVARAVIGDAPSDQLTSEALQLLDRWIDDPTDERCKRIGAILFDSEIPAEIGPYGVGWWVLRTATSSVGCHEAGWALSTTLSAAEAAGFSSESMRDVARRAVMSRRSVG